MFIPLAAPHQSRVAQMRRLSRLRQLGAASLLERRARDARSSGELSKLHDVKEHTPCPHSNLTSKGTHKGTVPHFTVRAENRSSTLLRAAELLAEALTNYECRACQVFYVSKVSKPALRPRKPSPPPPHSPTCGPRTVPIAHHRTAHPKPGTLVLRSDALSYRTSPEAPLSYRTLRP